MADTEGRGRSVFRRAVVALVGLAALAAEAEARGDRIVLRGGGQLAGKVEPDPKHDDRVNVLTDRGKTPLSFPKARIVQVIAEPSILDDYLTKRDTTLSTAEAQFELGRWCESHKLPDLAYVHYEAAVGADKTFAPAHRKLGHVLYEDRWLTPDERSEAQGLIRSRGRWITRAEKEQQEGDAARAAEQATWARRIRLLREAMAYSSEGRRREAEAQLMEVRDPVAIAPLVRVLGGDVGPARILLAHVLGAIPGPEATTALVARLLDEGEPDVRFAVMDELLRRNEIEGTRALVKALRSDRPEVVNRAAWGLSNLHAVSAVPSLVGVLITVRQEVIMASPGGPVGEGPSVSVAFGSVPPGPTAGGSPGAVAPPGPGIGPYSAGVGVSAGGGVTAARGPFPRLVRVPYRNAEVLAALVKLTGQNFGWDVDSWKRWVRSSFNAEPAPARRVPQP